MRTQLAKMVVDTCVMGAMAARTSAIEHRVLTLARLPNHLFWISRDRQKEPNMQETRRDAHI